MMLHSVGSCRPTNRTSSNDVIRLPKTKTSGDDKMSLDYQK